MTFADGKGVIRCVKSRWQESFS